MLTPDVVPRTGTATEQVALNGWVHELLPERAGFVLRNAAGLTEVRCAESDRTVLRVLRRLRPEYVVRVDGVRQADGRVDCSQIVVVNTCESMPFTGTSRQEASARQRARHRYLEFRDPAVLDVLRRRHAFVRSMCNHLDGHGFVSVETPLLAHPAGSGATEIRVASSRHPDVVYALPQSAQVFGQLVVAGGVERYYQLSRCFRDEDLRSDRQPEFTQLQVEVAFAGRDDVVELLERGLVEAAASVDRALPDRFPRLSYRECMRSFGTDKPDLRAEPEVTLLPVRLYAPGDAAERDLFTSRLPGWAEPTDAWWQGVATAAQVRGTTLLGFADQATPRSFLPLRLRRGEAAALLRLRPRWRPGSVAVWEGSWRQVHRLRKLLYRAVATTGTPPPELRPAWVVDIPLFELDETSGSLAAANHPFVAPADPAAFLAARSRAELLTLDSTSFDLVLNGEEVGSGSVVNHRMDVQLRVLELLSLSRKDVRGGFGFILESMRYGAPPIAGFGMGVDRMVALLLDKERIREVMAFPKTKQGYCPVTWRG